MPLDTEVFLNHVVLDPMISHINGPGALLFDGVICYAIGGGIIGDNGGGWLGVAHAVKGSAHDCAIFAVDKEGPLFGLGCSRGNVPKNSRWIENGAVVEVQFAISVSKIKMVPF
jgi:hypothetical protein